MTEQQEGKLNDRYGCPAGLDVSPGTADRAREQAGQSQLEPEGVLFFCETEGCLSHRKTVELPASWARIGVQCINCGLSMTEGSGDGPVEVR